MREIELDLGVSKTLVVTAGIAALRLLEKEERAAVLRWAKLIDDGEIEWAEFEKAADLKAGERMAALQKLAAEALRRAAEEGGEGSTRCG